MQTQTVETTGPKIRGSVIGPAYAWMLKSYGDALIQRGRARLSAQHRDIVDGRFLASATYPLDAWNHFLEAMAIEVQAATGTSSEQFFTNLVRASVSGAATTVFSFLLGVFQPKTILQRLPFIAGRVYENVELRVLENVHGHFVADVSGESEIVRKNVGIAFLPTTVLLAEMARAKNIKASYSKNVSEGRGFRIEITIDYT